VLTLRFLAGLPHNEVAVQLGKSPEAVRALQYRALKSLRARLPEDL
jgi:DNA-directed RNA polymerase specialized sigma24 family protein